MPSKYYQINNTTITLKLYVQPGSKKNAILGLFEGALKIKLATQPIEGQANLALIKYLSQELQVPKSKILLKKGDKSRHKSVEIQVNDLNLINRLEQIEFTT